MVLQGTLRKSCLLKALQFLIMRQSQRVGLQEILPENSVFGVLGGHVL